MRVSLIFPFRDDGHHRAEIWDWVRRYWSSHLPDAEIVVGNDDGVPFSKSCAVNDAASRATGDVFVVMDADAVIAHRVVLRCASQALNSRTRTWFVPYTLMYRLREVPTSAILRTDPRSFTVSKPDRTDYSSIVRGHHAGALCQVIPRAAFEATNGWESRMRGWGHEDWANSLALDILWGKRRWTANPALHLWHAREGTVHTKMWKGQREPHANDELMGRYRDARRSREAMRALRDEYPPPNRRIASG